MAETWRPVKASRMYRVPGRTFEASSEGRVRLVSGQMLDGSPDEDGYLRVQHVRKFFVHVLVILAWQGEPQVRHLGESNQDNRPAKLAYGSARENGRDKGNRGRKERGVSPPPQRLQPVTGDVQG